MSKIFYSLRFRKDQTEQIDNVRAFCQKVIALQSRVVGGSYNDHDLHAFWDIAASAGVTLLASNSELADRANLGDKFFTSIVRNRRRPKLANMLSALDAILNIASERLSDVGGVYDQASSKDFLDARSRTGEETFILAASLARLAREEIERLDNERPNALEAVAKSQNQRELLVIFAEGLEKIAQNIAGGPGGEPARWRERIATIVAQLGKDVETWWRKNKAEAVDWGVKIPVLTAGVALMNSAGADMTIATTAVAALVGGDKIIKSLKSPNK